MIKFKFWREIEKLYYIVRHILSPKQARSFSLCKEKLTNGVGLEIGGPSPIFSRRGILPLYTILRTIDSVNFSDNTIWSSGNTSSFQWPSKGKQLIDEASSLTSIPSAIYDCVLSSHVIEHLANPLKALEEWSRVMKESGILTLVVPHKEGTFDHRRPVTTLDHLLNDYEHGTTEGDMFHLPEILQLHDLGRDPGAGSYETFKKRSERNMDNRALHHHVFDTALVIAMVDYMKYQILAVTPILSRHIVVVAQKLPMGKAASNKTLIENVAKQNYYSPFASDRRPAR